MPDSYVGDVPNKVVGFFESDTKNYKYLTLEDIEKGVKE